MAVPSSRTINYDAVLSLCLENMRRTIYDNIFSSTPFLSAIYGKYGKKKAKGKGIKLLDGGERIRVPLMYGKNTTAKSYSGYDILDITPQDGITTAFFDWKQMAVSISISGKEEKQNKGEGKIKGLLETKITQAEMSLFEELNLQLLGKTVSSSVFVEGNGMSASSDLTPLPIFLPKDPTSSVSVGNIDQSTYSWWRPRVVDGTQANATKDAGADRGFNCATWAVLQQAMRWAYNTCGRGAGGSPDLILCDQMGYESYEAGLDNRSRIHNDSKGPVSVGFESVRFKGADMIWDEFMPDVDTGVIYNDSNWARSTMMFLNTDFIELCIESSSDFVSTPFQKPVEQDAKTSHILMMGNLTCSNRRKQGIIYGITAGITS